MTRTRDPIITYDVAFSRLLQIILCMWLNQQTFPQRGSTKFSQANVGAPPGPLKAIRRNRLGARCRRQHDPRPHRRHLSRRSPPNQCLQLSTRLRGQLDHRRFLSPFPASPNHKARITQISRSGQAQVKPSDGGPIIRLKEQNRSAPGTPHRRVLSAVSGTILL